MSVAVRVIAIAVELLQEERAPIGKGRMPAGRVCAGETASLESFNCGPPGRFHARLGSPAAAVRLRHCLADDLRRVHGFRSLASPRPASALMGYCGAWRRDRNWPTAASVLHPARRSRVAWLVWRWQDHPCQAAVGRSRPPGRPDGLGIEFLFLRWLGRSPQVPPPSAVQVCCVPGVRKASISSRPSAGGSLSAGKARRPSLRAQGKRVVILVHGFFCNRGFGPMASAARCRRHSHSHCEPGAHFRSIDDYAPRSATNRQDARCNRPRARGRLPYMGGGLPGLVVAPVGSPGT